MVVMEILYTHISCFGPHGSATDRFIQYLLVCKKLVLDYESGEIRRCAKDDRGGVGKIYFGT